MRRLFACFLAAFLLAGCIPIGDLGEYWAKGTIDPALDGSWKKAGAQRSEDQFHSFERSGDIYSWTMTSAMEQKGTPKQQFQVKTLALGKHKFLMVGLDQTYDKLKVPKAERPAIGGGLIRYKMDGPVLVIYRLKESVLWKAIEEKKVAGRLPDENDRKNDSFMPPALAKLDEKTAAFIETLAENPDNWQEPERYEKVADLAKAIEVSRTYPATPDTPANTLVTVHQPDLKYFAEGHGEILRRQLQASPDWRVFNERGQTVAYERQNRTVSLNGYYSTRTSPRTQTRKMFRFANQPGGGWTDTFFLGASPAEGDVHLRLRSSGQGIESYLAVGEGNLWFEIFEQSETEPRAQTREALAWIEQFLKDVRANEDEIRRQGYAAKLLPADAIRHGAPELQLSDGMQGGIYDARGWVNPGKPGYVYLKAFNVETGARLSAERMTPASNELVGWSANPSEIFYYNTNIVVYEGDWDHFYDARFELWFQPDDGAPEAKLVETTRKICGWER